VVLNAIAASSVSNMLGYLIGHPLDTVRVRMQLESRKISASQVLMETIKNEGPSGLYKGVTQPLIGAVPINSM
jgi:solute carrier family 25 (mitochondrial carnitine/acylcarnitine transporter), member 20/29